MRTGHSCPTCGGATSPVEDSGAEECQECGTQVIRVGGCLDAVEAPLFPMEAYIDRAKVKERRATQMEIAI